MSDIKYTDYRIHYEECYAPYADITFIMKNEYIRDGLIRTQVISWYSGEPNIKDTLDYIAKPNLIAEYKWKDEVEDENI